MLNRVTVATFLSLLVGLFAASSASAAQPSDRDPIPPPTDYWQDKGFILMAHQGGEWDFPPNTMYAYKSAIAAGADMIDMDAWVTSDGGIVLTHDRDASDNSDAPNDTFITDTQLSQLKTYDFAYKWTPHGSPGGTEPPFRGIATGDVPPPSGFTAEDFQIPTFGEVLEEFPNVPINIELKQVDGLTPEEINETAEKMAGILASHPGHDENVIINSFGQEMLDAVHAARPEHKSFGGSQDATLGYINGKAITPTPVAVEPPDLFSFGGTLLRTVPILKPWADHDGYKIFVWGSDHDEAQDTDPFYAKLIAEGTDSYNTPSPTRLAKYLCFNGIARPDGSPRCAVQICPEGQTGIAPDNCVDVPVAVCPEGQTGTPPDNCVDVPVAVCPEGQTGTPPDCVTPKVKVSKVRIGPKKGKIRAGRKTRVRIKVTAMDNGRASWAKIHLKSSNKRVKLRKFVKIRLRPGATVKKTVTVKATRKARGKAKLTARVGKRKARTTLRVKAQKRKSKKRNAGSAHKHRN